MKLPSLWSGRSQSVSLPRSCRPRLEVLESRTLLSLSDGLQAYYPFNGNGLDSSGNGRDLTLVGNPTFAAGKFGQALVLDGTGNQYAVRPVSDSVFNFGSNDFTVQVWVNYSLSPAVRQQVLIEKFTGATGPGWTLTSADSHFEFYPFAFGLDIGSFTTGVWHDVVAERSANILNFFYDGRHIAGVPAVGAITDTTNPLLIGRRNMGDDRNFALAGAVDDVAIWNRALTADEIATLWNGGAGTPVLPAVTHYGVSAPANTTAGTSFSVTVTALDANNQTATSYMGTVHFTSTDPNAVLPPNYTFVAADAGVHTFPVTLTTAGSRTVTVTDTTTASITGSAAVTVSPAAASSFTVTGLPASLVAGTPANVTVTAYDLYHNLATGYRGAVAFASTDNNASLPPVYTFTAADAGAHTFSPGAILRTAGLRFVIVYDTGNPSIDGTSGGVTVLPAAADQFAVTTSAAHPQVAGTPFDVTVTALDPYSNQATGYLGSVTFTSADPYGASLPADYTFGAADAGAHTFPAGATLYTAGVWDVTATDTVSGITGAAFVNVQAASAVAFQVAAPGSAQSGVPFDVTLMAVDPYGNTDTHYLGTATWTSSDQDPGVVLPPDYAFRPGDQGVVTFTGGVTLVTPDDQSITATDTVSGITGTATITVTTGPSRRGRLGSAAAAPDSAGVDQLFGSRRDGGWWASAVAALVGHRRAVGDATAADAVSWTLLG
jgi:hypothetical protein